ncbi:MAG: HEAT repeat domain-containing protein [Deltaproteobacteria bacterium]|nr:HEAT repeat domain-containing protein [Deltaproteobacteria bacterium]
METKLKKNATELVFLINAAINNIRMYPATSTIMLQAVDRIHAAMDRIMQTTDSVEYAKSGKTPLVLGEPLENVYKNKAPIISFFGMMIDLDIRSITIEKGITKREIIGFVQTFAKSGAEIKKAGGPTKMLEKEDVSHIIINEIVYVEMDSDQRLTEMDIHSEEIADYIVEDKPIPTRMIKQVKILAKEPEWISEVFQICINKVMETAQQCPVENFSKTLQRVTESLTNLSGKNQAESNDLFLHALAEMDDLVLLTMWTHNLEHLFSDRFYRYFIEELNDDKFNALIRSMKAIPNSDKENSGCETPLIASRYQVTNLLNNIKKTQRLYKKTKKTVVDDDSSLNTHRLRADQLQTALNTLLRSQNVASPDLMMLNGLAKTVENLLANDKFLPVVSLFDQLRHLLLNKDVEIRITAAELLSKIETRLNRAGRLEERIKLSIKLMDWIRSENQLSPIYEKITGQLKDLSEELIRMNRAGDTDHIIRIYRQISNGEIEKNSEVQVVCQKMVEDLASEEILDVLIKRSKIEQADGPNEDVGILAAFGHPAMERLLDLLYDSKDRAERNRIVRLITEIGEPALKPLIQRLQKGGPWFYARNLLLLLGRLGNESHLDVLETFLKDKDDRIIRESVVAMQNIGGGEAGRMLSGQLSKVNDEIKGLIIHALGMIGYWEGVPFLLNMLESRALGHTKAAKNNLMIKICDTLGRLKEPHAIPVLEKITTSRGFLIKTYDPAVKAAARKALTKINTAGSSL